jgi:hypothetical protein
VTYLPRKKSKAVGLIGPERVHNFRTDNFFPQILVSEGEKVKKIVYSGQWAPEAHHIVMGLLIWA